MMAGLCILYASYVHLVYILHASRCVHLVCILEWCRITKAYKKFQVRKIRFNAADTPKPGRLFSKTCASWPLRASCRDATEAEASGGQGEHTLSISRTTLQEVSHSRFRPMRETAHLPETARHNPRSCRPSQKPKLTAHVVSSARSTRRTKAVGGTDAHHEPVPRT